MASGNIVTYVKKLGLGVVKRLRLVRTRWLIMELGKLKLSLFIRSKEY